ncbi:8994_t:CDS:2, partial [Entrophospora sp. SA101]
MSKQEQQDVILNSDTNNGNITNDTTTTDTNHADKNFYNRAYAFTSVLSVMLLGTWAIPVCMLSSIVFLKVGYHWSQYFGVLICLVGIGVLLAGDLDSGQDFSGAVNMGLGDAFCIIGATLYGASNVIEELLVRQRSVYEVVGQLGFWGMIISGIQFLILERQELSAVEWNGSSVGMLLAYTISMVFFYTGAPILFKLSSATFFNLSLQTIHFYSLIFSLLLFESRPSYSHPAFPSIGRDCSDVKGNDDNEGQNSDEIKVEEKENEYKEDLNDFIDIHKINEFNHI